MAMSPASKKTLKEMCAEFDVTPRTLRYYEYIELLSPAREGRTRYYSSREIARLTLILNGRRFGFSLEQIRRWLELYDTSPGNQAQIEEWERMASEQIEELKARRAQLDTTISDLIELKETAHKTLVH